MNTRLITLLLITLSMTILISAGPNQLFFSYSFDLDLYSQDSQELAIKEFVQPESVQSGHFILKEPYNRILQLKRIDKNTLRFSYSSFEKDSLRDVCLMIHDFSRKLNISDEIDFPFNSKGNAALTLRTAIKNFPQDKISNLNRELERLKLMNALELINRPVGPFTPEEILFGRSSYSRGYYVNLEDLGNVRSLRGLSPVIEFRTSFYDTPDESFKVLMDAARMAINSDTMFDSDNMVNSILRNQPELLLKLLPHEYFLNATDEEARSERFRGRLFRMLKFYESDVAYRYPLIRKSYPRLIKDPRYKRLLIQLFGRTTRVEQGLEVFINERGYLALRKNLSLDDKSCFELLSVIIRL